MTARKFIGLVKSLERTEPGTTAPILVFPEGKLPFSLLTHEDIKPYHLKLVSSYKSSKCQWRAIFLYYKKYPEEE